MERPSNELWLLRAHSGLSQAEFAAAMGVPFRTFQDLESGKSALRPVHLQAARMALVQLQTMHPDQVFIPMPIKDFIRHTAEQHNKDMSLTSWDQAKFGQGGER